MDEMEGQMISQCSVESRGLSNNDAKLQNIFTVCKAGKSGGTDMKDFLQSETRGSVLSHDGVEILQTERDENGVITSEDYFVQKKKGSIFRAIMHGVLDLATLGAWEIIGTPIEMSKEGKEGVPVRVFYTEDGKTIKMEFIN